MSEDNLPCDIQVEILRRLPVKSLLQFRSVSKQMKSLIDDSDFVLHYSAQQQHLLVKYYVPLLSSKPRYVSIVDDHTFPQQKVPHDTHLFVRELQHYITIGCAHGLLCFYGDYIIGKGRVVIWNPSIRKAIAVAVPKVSNRRIYETTLGFGVCPKTADLKIVKITYIKSPLDIERISCIPRQVEIFTLRTGAWRCPYSSSLPHKSVLFQPFNHGVIVGGFLYWLAIASVVEYEFRYNIIIIFDMTSEEFRELDLPDSLRYGHLDDLRMYKLRESLVVLESCLETNDQVYSVWMLEDGVPDSFTKLFTINTGDDTIIGFRNTGIPIIEVVEGLHKASKVVVYEPCTKHIDLGVNGIDVCSFVYTCKETLLLLDQPDFSVYVNGKRYISLLD